MNSTRKVSFSFSGLLALAAALVAAPTFADGGCAQWDMSGYWHFVQSNGVTPGFTLQQVGTNLHGHGSYLYTTEHSAWVIGTVVDDHSGDGPAVGTINGNSFELTVYWNNNTIGVYTGEVGPQGLIVGTTFDKNDPGTTAQWHSDRVMTCSAAATPLAPTVAFAVTHSSGPMPAICDAAKSARARNSPAAPGLERQCAAQGGQPPSVGFGRVAPAAAPAAPPAAPPAAAPAAVPAAAPAIPAMPAPAPAKAMPPPPIDPAQLDALAANGAEIAGIDSAVDEARSVEGGVFYHLGFDIATGLFGDPLLGAQGNTVMGPGPLAIRDGLSASGQRGFDASVKFHLARDYRHP